jgi:hypothetical protein
LRLAVAVVKMKMCKNVRLGTIQNSVYVCSKLLLFSYLRVSANDLHASDGRDTEALNCKPITNL